MRKDLVYYYNELDRIYRSYSDQRWSTFKTAMNLFTQQDGRVIVETGCARIPNDWGGGLSTLMFGKFCELYGNDSHLWTVDISFTNIAACKSITREFEDYITYATSDSVIFLETWTGDKIDFLYLDSFDYPYWEMIKKMGRTQGDVETENRERGQEFEAETVASWSNLIDPCQIHCLNELNAALPHLHDKTIILIDDNALAGGGKSRVAKERLIELGWTCLLDWQQTLWIKW